MSYEQSHVTVTLTISEAKALGVAAKPGIQDPANFVNGHVRQAAWRGNHKLAMALNAHQRQHP